jgi:hypothetical protein
MHYRSGRMMEAPHGVAPVARANKPPANAVKQPLAQAPTAPATIRIDVGKLLTRQLGWRDSFGAPLGVGAAALQEEQEQPPE